MTENENTTGSKGKQMKKTRLVPSSFLAWLEAGVELTAGELARLVGIKHPQAPASHHLLEALQQRGEELDQELRHAFSSAGVAAAIEKMMYTNPVYKLMTGSERNNQEHEQQLDLLSGKVDLLIAQVALLNASVPDNGGEGTDENRVSPFPAEKNTGSYNHSDTPPTVEKKEPKSRSVPKPARRSARTQHQTKPGSKES